LELAYKNGASGYLAGGTIWYDSFLHYPDISKVDNGLKKESVKYIKKINDLTARNAYSLKTYFENGFKIHKPEQFTQDFGGFK
jgi:tagatose 1,6-diphosphate aldolase